MLVDKEGYGSTRRPLGSVYAGKPLRGRAAPLFRFEDDDSIPPGLELVKHIMLLGAFGEDDVAECHIVLAGGGQLRDRINRLLWETLEETS